jgi:acetyl esterase/lipase
MLTFSLLLLTAVAAPAEEAPSTGSATIKVDLWAGTAPLEGGKSEKVEVPITIHRPRKANGTAVIICPGGGYGGRVSGAEGHGIAKWLGQHGITGIVLDYRLPAGRSHVPLWDAQRAIRTARHRATEWGLKTDRIGIAGFSAGGHLAATAGTHFDSGNPQSSDEVEKVSCRPDFMILVYPVISMGPVGHGGSRRNLLGEAPSAALVREFSNELQVTKQTPPTFLAHADDDKPVPPKNSQLFYEALVKHDVPAQFLELPSGGHGLNGYKGPMWDAWQRESLVFLKTNKLTD